METNSNRLVLRSGVTAKALEDDAVRILDGSSGPLAITLRHSGSSRIGADARMLGLLARLRRIDRPVHVHLHTGDNQPGLREDSAYRKFFKEELLGMLLGTYCTAVFKQDGTDITVEALDEQLPTLQASDGMVGAGNRRAWIIRDGLPNVRPRMFSTLLGGDRRLFGATLLETIQRTFSLTKPPAEAVQALTTYFWEVLKNTEMHGRLVDGRAAEGVRFFEAKRYRAFDLDTAALAGDGETHLAAYLDGVRRRYGDADLIEFTIADAGPGIAETMSGTPDIYGGDLLAEETITRYAFTRVGTSRLKQDPDAGGGLDDALNACRMLHGLMIVRTGRLELTRHFVSTADDHTAPADLASLAIRHDRALAHLGGTSVSVVLPWGVPPAPSRVTDRRDGK